MIATRQLIDNGDGTATVPLTRGYVAVIDIEDAAEIGRYNWYAKWCGKGWLYACRAQREPGRGRSSRTVFMHRVVCGGPPDRHVDHRNSNGLDNRRANLRVATVTQNCANSKRPSSARSPYKGVTQLPSGRWQAQITANRRCHYLGLYDTPEAAHAAYCKAAAELHGEFARTA